MRRIIILLSITINAIACLGQVVAQGKTMSGLLPERFDTIIDNRPTALYVLTNSRGAEACVTNLGARLVSLMMPDRNGRMEDVVLGYDNITDYHTKGQNFGATVGRYVGRIIGPRFTLDGTEYPLQDLGKGVISHGGKPGFADRIWEVTGGDHHNLTLRYVSPDGENGFPGTLTVTLTYTLTDDNDLKVDFTATTDKATVLNLTNHSFFNISGNLTKDILNETLWIDSKRIATYDDNKNVDGRMMKVCGTPFDFRKPHRIGERIDADDRQLKVTGGYDHAFQLRHAGNLKRPAAILKDYDSGRMMTVFTTEPAIQIYTGNGLKGNQIGKGGIIYNRRTAICLETQHFADSPNKPQFPSTVLRPGNTFRSTTIFSFSTF